MSLLVQLAETTADPATALLCFVAARGGVCTIEDAVRFMGMKRHRERFDAVVVNLNMIALTINRDDGTLLLMRGQWALLRRRRMDGHGQPGLHFEDGLPEALAAGPADCSMGGAANGWHSVRSAIENQTHEPTAPPVEQMSMNDARSVSPLAVHRLTAKGDCTEQLTGERLTGNDEHALMNRLKRFVGEDDMRSWGGDWRKNWVRRIPHALAKAIAILEAESRQGWKAHTSRAAALKDLAGRLPNSP